LVPGRVWSGVENLAPPPPTGIRSPNRPVCSESLYRQSYSGLLMMMIIVIVIMRIIIYSVQLAVIGRTLSKKCLVSETVLF